MEIAIAGPEALYSTLEAHNPFLLQQMEGAMGRERVLEPDRAESECPFGHLDPFNLRQVTEL